jgi:gliding motility-associated-like protein
MKGVKKYLFFVGMLLMLQDIRSQSSKGFYGREFWFTYTQNLYSPNNLLVYVVPETVDTISIFNPQTNFSIAPAVVRPGIWNPILIPVNMAYSVLAFGPQGTGVVLRSKREVQVFAANILMESREVTAVLPSENLKNAQEYIVNMWSGHRDKESQVAIMAIDTGITKVSVSLSADLFTGQGQGSVLNLSLQRGQVYLLQALDTQNLSGTIIKVTQGCKRLAVFQGVKSARIGYSSSCITYDHLYEQAWPTVYWGIDFVVPPVQKNDRFQISVVASEDNTTVKFPAGNVLLNRGGVYRTRIISNAATVVYADKPISCLQATNSSGCNGSITNKGDASILNIAPVELACKAKKIAFAMDGDVRYNHFISIVTTSPAVPKITLNRKPLTMNAPWTFVTLGSGKKYLWSWFEVPAATLNAGVLESDSGMIVYQHSLADFEAFSTCLGAALTNNRGDFSISPSPLCRGSQQALIKATGNNLNNLIWLFEDGSSDTGNPVNRSFGKNGFHKVKMLNTTGNACPADTVERTVWVTGVPDFFLPRDTQPCIGSVFRIQLPVIDQIDYTWENGSKSVLQTILANRKAVLTIRDTNGCEVKDTIDVRFKNCDERDLRLANVFTPDENEKNDAWKIYFKGWDTIDVEIYSRWGVRVASYGLPSEDHWNGKVMNKGNPLPEGTYFFTLRCFDKETDTEKRVTGSINLIR